MTFDEMRARYPHLGYAVYAYSPGGSVTLEITGGDESWTVEAPTMEMAIDCAYPPDLFEQEPEPEPDPVIEAKPGLFD